MFRTTKYRRKIVYSLLQLSESKKEAKSWGVLAGKLEREETPEEGLRRELFEETGIILEAPTQVHTLGRLYMRNPDLDYVYHVFGIQLPEAPKILLSSEHTDYRWILPNEWKDFKLMEGEEEALHFYVNRLKKKRSGANVNVYLILRREDAVLLHLRKNTGYCDGYYGLVSGHVEDGESAMQAMIREAYEETGIQILPEMLQTVHIMHRKTNRFNVDIFFECYSWLGTIKNQEPEKCEALEFFALKNLPAKIIDYVSWALDCSSKENFYSERGWEEKR